MEGGAANHGVVPGRAAGPGEAVEGADIDGGRRRESRGGAPAGRGTGGDGWRGGHRWRAAPRITGWCPGGPLDRERRSKGRTSMEGGAANHGVVPRRAAGPGETVGGADIDGARRRESRGGSPASIGSARHSAMGSSGPDSPPARFGGGGGPPPAFRRVPKPKAFRAAARAAGSRGAQATPTPPASGSSLLPSPNRGEQGSSQYRTQVRLGHEDAGSRPAARGDPPSPPGGTRPDRRIDTRGDGAESRTGCGGSRE